MIARILPLILACLVTACGGKIAQELYPGSLEVAREITAPEQRFLTRADGQQREYFWLKAQNPRGTILYLHGNGSLARDLYEPLQSERLPYDIAILEYTGYAENSGVASEQELRKDVLAISDKLQGSRIQRPLILVGTSLGGSLAIITANDVKPDALLTFAPFTSTADLAPKWAKQIISSSNAYDALGAAQDLTMPWLNIHCKGDQVIPVSMAKRFADAAQANADTKLDLLLSDCDYHAVPPSRWHAALARLTSRL